MGRGLSPAAEKAEPFGMTYGGPGMVFGYLSGKHAAERRTNR